MAGSFLFLDYLLWHYTVAFRDMSVMWFNFMWFTIHFFSIPLLIRTLFSPWKRITEEYQKKGLEDLAGTVLVNIMTRIVGAIIRVGVIIIGLLFLLMVFAGFLVFIVVWVLLPFLTIYAVLYGITLLFV